MSRPVGLLYVALTWVGSVALVLSGGLCEAGVARALRRMSVPPHNRAKAPFYFLMVLIGLVLAVLWAARGEWALALLSVLFSSACCRPSGSSTRSRRRRDAPRWRWPSPAR